MGRDLMNISGALIGLGLIAILGFMSWALVFIDVPASNETSMSILLGILSAQVSVVIGFHFGSSMANKKQAETIDKQASTIQKAQAALAPLADTIPVAPGEAVTVTGTDGDPP